MTPKEWLARSEAYHEAAEHIGEMDWTDDPAERKQGKIVAEKLRDESIKCAKRANR